MRPRKFAEMHTTNGSGRLTRSQYQILVEQAPMMIWRSDTTGACDYFNERWLNFRGRTLEQESGNQWAEGVHPGDREHCLEIYLDAFQKREAFEMTYRLERHDGDYRWIFDTGAPYFTDDRFQGYIGSCIDVSERIEAQRALDEARDRELANLRGILPICMRCKKIRGSDGAWEQLESFIRDHSRAAFSHGLCPVCYAVYEEQIGRAGAAPRVKRAST
jgi:PAS domain S-box-containing protein